MLLFFYTLYKVLNYTDMLEYDELKFILDHFEEFVMDLLEKKKGMHDDNVNYTEYHLSYGATDIDFDWYYVDEQFNDRTLHYRIFFNNKDLQADSGINKAAKIPDNLSDRQKVILKLAYIAWKVYEQVEMFFEENTSESDEICASTKDRVWVIVDSEGHTKFRIL